MMNRSRLVASLALLLFTTAGADAQIRITEWMYSGANGEFVELTNIGTSPIDMREGWFYSDSDRDDTDLDLAIFGIVGPGESVLITDALEEAFRTAWALDPSVKVFGANVNSNLGRVDEINIFHAGELVDRLTYGDNRVPTDPPEGAPETAGSIRTQNRSGNPSSMAALGANDVFQWVLASTAAEGPDKFGSYTSATGDDRANPGFFSIALALAGDFNGDGTVDAADYTVWRDTDNTPEAYANWKANFGQTAGGQGGQALTSAAVPEPAGTALLGTLIATLAIFRRRPRESFGA